MIADHLESSVVYVALVATHSIAVGKCDPYASAVGGARVSVNRSRTTGTAKLCEAKTSTLVGETTVMAVAPACPSSVSALVDEAGHAWSTDSVYSSWSLTDLDGWLAKWRN